MAAFWYIVPFSLVEVYRRFRGAYYVHHQGLIVSSVDCVVGGYNRDFDVRKLIYARL
jgi:hypothetical protein